MARRGMDHSPLFWLTIVPLLGPCVYLIVRSPLVAPTSKKVESMQGDRA
jgi:hypothetical protein